MSVPFAVYGDGADYQDWIEVWLNGTICPYNDPTLSWTLTSFSGPLPTIPRPITDGLISFTNAQTGTVQIVGARRPRRLVQFSENQGVAARDLNQTLTDMIAEGREGWDWMRERTISVPAGETLPPLPPATVRADFLLGFDASGNPTLATSAGGGGGMSTTFDYGTVTGGSITIFSLIPTQKLINNGSFTINAPTADTTAGPINLLITNSNSIPGTIAFAGFSVGSNIGDVLNTVLGSKWTVTIWRINAIAGYRIFAHQNPPAFSAAQTFASLPSAVGNEGMVATVSDSIITQWGQPIVGGGTFVVLAYSDGFNWIVAGT
jgi:hypothetical protein